MGDVAFDLIKDALPLCSPEQLLAIEDESPVRPARPEYCN
jgi:hypothetical protein